MQLLSLMEPPINKIDQSDYMKLKKYLFFLEIEGFNKTKCLYSWPGYRSQTVKAVGCKM